MNHKTPAEERLAAAIGRRATADDFRARLSRLSLPQLREALRYLRGWNEAAVERALQFADTPFDRTPHRAAGEEMPCLNQDPDGGYICLAQRGHAGPVHVAYGTEGETVATWPVAPEDGRQAALHATIADLVLGGRP